MAKGWQEGRQTILKECRAEDGQPGGGRQTESRVVMMEGGDRRDLEQAGASWDPGRSHDDGGPRWSRRREEPWRRKG